MSASLGQYTPASLPPSGSHGTSGCPVAALSGCWFIFCFAACTCRELLSPFSQEPGPRQQLQKPGLEFVINPKTIMGTSEPIIIPDIHVSNSDI